MPETIHDITAIQQEALFEGVGIRGYRAIASMAVQKFFKSGDILIRKGEEVLSLFLLLDGEVGVFDDEGPPERRPRVTLANGHTVGEVGLLSGRPADETCVVVSDFLEALVFSRQAFYEIMSLYPQIGINLCKRFALRLTRPT